MKAAPLLMIGATFALFYQGTASKRQCLAKLPAQPGVLEALLPLLRPTLEPLTVVLDLPEQDYLLEPLPKLNPRDRAAYLRSKAQRAFAGCPGGVGQYAKDAQGTERAMISGAPASLWIGELLDGLAAAGHCIDVIYFHSDLVGDTTTKTAAPQLFILRGLGGGIRHVLAQNGLTLFTRLCQEPGENPASELARDIATTCHYLRRKALLAANQPLAIHVDPVLAAITELETALAVQPEMPPCQIELATVDVFTALQKRRAAYHALPLSRSLQQRRKQYRRCRLFAGASAMTAACVLGLSSFLLGHAFRIQTEISALALLPGVQTTTEFESDAAIDRAAVQLFQPYMVATPDLESALQAVSMVLSAVPQLRLEQACWQSAPETASTMARQQRQLDAVFDGNAGSEHTVFALFRQQMLEQGALAVSRHTTRTADTKARWQWQITFAPAVERKP